MIAIFVASSRRVPKSVESLGVSDVLLHAGVYALLGLTLSRAFAVGAGARGWRGLVLLPALIGTLYGITDEWHQSFVPGRDPSIDDAVADAAGALAGAAVWAVGQGWRRLD
jgi:VanZ family protein